MAWLSMRCVHMRALNGRVVMTSLMGGEGVVYRKRFTRFRTFPFTPLLHPIPLHACFRWFGGALFWFSSFLPLHWFHHLDSSLTHLITHRLWIRSWRAVLSFLFFIIFFNSPFCIFFLESRPSPIPYIPGSVGGFCPLFLDCCCDYAVRSLWSATTRISMSGCYKFCVCVCWRAIVTRMECAVRFRSDVDRRRRRHDYRVFWWSGDEGAELQTDSVRIYMRT